MTVERAAFEGLPNEVQQAVEQGRQARLSGQTVDACPHHANEPMEALRRKAWLNGSVGLNLVKDAGERPAFVIDAQLRNEVSLRFAAVEDHWNALRTFYGYDFSSILEGENTR
ncbi:Rmf/CrpP family protein [Nitrospirillum amazonense]|uniref:Rmf/CrpP family protein n=1 Tax=Nitrospirillum amazonense TaxID=28077 RepID=UPI002412B866|nr:Rmf/CrpP family protein [Nitrospirillum amazonense]MDG3444583.1 hypothetical protein [Nitrospirillum amazonense]